MSAQTVPREEFTYWSVSSSKGPRHQADGWTHVPCGMPASKEHNGRECGSCRNWNGCGGDCDLSGLVCPRCNVRADYP